MSEPQFQDFQIHSKNADGTWVAQSTRSDRPRARIMGCNGAVHGPGDIVPGVLADGDSQQVQLLDRSQRARPLRQAKPGWGTAKGDGTRRSCSPDGILPAQMVFDPSFDIHPASSLVYPMRIDDRTQRIVMQDGKVFAPTHLAMDNATPPNTTENTDCWGTEGVPITTWIVAGGIWFGYGEASDQSYCQVTAVDVGTGQRLWSYRDSLWGTPVTGISGWYAPAGGVPTLLVDRKRSVLYLIRFAPIPGFRITALNINAAPAGASAGVVSLFTGGTNSQVLWTLDLPVSTNVLVNAGTSEGDLTMLDSSGRLILGWVEDLGSVSMATAEQVGWDPYAAQGSGHTYVNPPVRGAVAVSANEEDLATHIWAVDPATHTSASFTVDMSRLAPMEGGMRYGLWGLPYHTSVWPVSILQGTTMLSMVQRCRFKSLTQITGTGWTPYDPYGQPCTAPYDTIDYMGATVDSRSYFDWKLYGVDTVLGINWSVNIETEDIWGMPNLGWCPGLQIDETPVLYNYLFDDANPPATPGISLIGTAGRGQFWRMLGGDDGTSVFVARDGIAGCSLPGRAVYLVRTAYGMAPSDDPFYYAIGTYGGAQFAYWADRAIMAAKGTTAPILFPGLPCTIRQYSATNGDLLCEVNLPPPGGPNLQFYTIAGFAGVGSSAIFVRNLMQATVTWGGVDWAINSSLVSQDIGIWNSDGSITWTTLPDIAQYSFVSGLGSQGAVWTTQPVQTGVKMNFPAGSDLVVVQGKVYVPTSDGHLRRII